MASLVISGKVGQRGAIKLFWLKATQYRLMFTDNLVRTLEKQHCRERGRVSGRALWESRSAVSSRQHDWRHRTVTGRAVRSTKKLVADSNTWPCVNTESKCWLRRHARALFALTEWRPDMLQRWRKKWKQQNFCRAWNVGGRTSA